MKLIGPVHLDARKRSLDQCSYSLSVLLTRGPSLQWHLDPTRAGSSRIEDGKAMCDAECFTGVKGIGCAPRSCRAFLSLTRSCMSCRLLFMFPPT